MTGFWNEVSGLVDWLVIDDNLFATYPSDDKPNRAERRAGKKKGGKSRRR